MVPRPRRQLPPHQPAGPQLPQPILPPVHPPIVLPPPLPVLPPAPQPALPIPQPINGQPQPLPIPHFLGALAPPPLPPNQGQPLGPPPPPPPPLGAGAGLGPPFHRHFTVDQRVEMAMGMERHNGVRQLALQDFRQKVKHLCLELILIDPFYFV